MWSDQFKAAAARGVVIAVLTALLTTLTTWSQTSDVKTLVIAGATSCISTFLVRSGLEGMYDTSRANKGETHPGDVGVTPTTR